MMKRVSRVVGKQEEDIVNNYRSKYEKRIAKNSSKGVDYETVKLEWQPPMKVYTPDWTLPNGILVESKGRFTSQDRTKMKCVKEQHPDKDIRLLFQNASVKLSKKSKTTYAAWAEKNGFKWAEGDRIPDSWLNE